MSYGGLEIIKGSTSPASLKRKRVTPSFSQTRPPDIGVSRLAAVQTNGAANSATRSPPPAIFTDAVGSRHHLSRDTDLMHPSENGDMLGAIGSASSLGSTESSAFSQTRKPSLANGLTPLTNHTDSSPPKGNSPLYPNAAEMASSDGPGAALRTPASQSLEPTPSRKERPRMLPPPGKVKGYRAVWDPELDVKLSKEERKRATQRKKEFGIEVRLQFHNLLSLNKIEHIT